MDAFGASSDDNSIPHLTGVMLRSHKFPFPSLQEQNAIASHLDERVAALDGGRAVGAHQITLLRECRARRVADVVTGQLDVREAARGLPDEVPAVAEPELDGEDAADEDEADEEVAE